VSRRLLVVTTVPVEDDVPRKSVVIVNRPGSDAGRLEEDAGSEAVARLDVPVTRLVADA
jgi:hypothetical protein